MIDGSVQSHITQLLRTQVSMSDSKALAPSAISRSPGGCQVPKDLSSPCLLCPLSSTLCPSPRALASLALRPMAQLGPRTFLPSFWT